MKKLKHSRSSTEYSSWTNMKYRCYNKNCPQYEHYGARGITVCDRWLNSFDDFYDDMGKKPDKSMSLDRIDVNGNYEPSNCRWATSQQQSRNKRKPYMGYTIKKTFVISKDLAEVYKLAKKRKDFDVVALCREAIESSMRELAKAISTQSI